MFPKQSKIFGLALGTVLQIALGMVVFWPAPPPPPLPNPNGYDDFLAAEQLVVGGALDLQELKGAELKTVVDQNRAALQALRQGLKKQCQMPLTWDNRASVQHVLIQHLQALKALGGLLAAEGKLAEHEGRMTDAVQSYLDLIRFGQEMSRGGLGLGKIVGIACERLALPGLIRLDPKLTSEQSRKLSKALEEIDRKREPWEAVLTRERIFKRRTSSFLRLVLSQIFFQKEEREFTQRFEEQAKAEEARLRLLMTDLAVRQFQGERGVYPSRLAELVPQFLQALPRDPFGADGFIYRPQTNGFLLYSVGPDGKDDGGAPITKGSKTGDIPSSTFGLQQ